jgi:hypothetical protein
MEFIYYCKYCEFDGKTLYGIKRHIMTAKHIKTSNNDIAIKNYDRIIYKCDECNKFYRTKSNINKHITSCHKKDDTEVESEITDMRSDDDSDSELDDLIFDSALKMKNKDKCKKMLKLYFNRETKTKNREIELTAKINDIYENENRFHKKVVENAGQLVGKSMNMLTYAVQHFKDTPKLEILDSTTARKLLKHEVDNGKKDKINNDQIAEYIAKISEAKILPKHLGNTLVCHYKKDDPDHQSLWTTDVSRMKFIAKTTDGWIKDNNSDMINKAIIIPLLKEVSKIMDEYCNERMSHISKMTGREEAKYVEVSEQRINIKSDIINEKLNKAILKHIAPCFLMQKQLK